MALTVQDDDGLVADANAYVDVAYVKNYWLDQGTDLSVTYTDPEIEAALVRATLYLDTRYRYVGQLRNQAQATQWPRRDALNRDDYYITGVPTAIKKASAELASRSLAAALLPDPTADATGRVVVSKTEKVGPLSESVEYAPGAAYQGPEYPMVTNLLLAAGLIRRGITAVLT